MMKRICAVACVLLAVAGGIRAQELDPDTVHPGRFDTGKMWTFEYPPAEYFSSTYGFQATPEWFERARLSALRIPGCSASFVSPNGLAVTNHHCVRGGVTQVQRAGEDLLEDGFLAHSLAEERQIPNYWVDQLLAVHDVSDEIFAATDAATTDAERQAARSRAVAAVQQRLGAQHPGARVDVVALYNGGRYSAYAFRRFNDVRLVAAAELQAGFFGGDADNFTYPRHALDFAFIRVYENGQPFRNTMHFGWSETGANEGDAVFIIGNPGPTNRLNTVAQLEFLRAVQVPATLSWLESRIEVLRAFVAASPEQADALDLRNRVFSLSNSQKANAGRRAALNSAYVMARRAAAERAFRDSLAARPALSARYGSVIDEIASIAQRKTALGAQYAAYAQLGSEAYESALIRRALFALQWQEARAAGASADTLAVYARRVAAVQDFPAALERELLAARLRDFQEHLPEQHAVLIAGDPADVAASLLAQSALADSARAAQALSSGTLSADDPALRIAAAVLPDYIAFQRELQQLGAREAELNADLGRARFEVYGTSVPPDATSSPRITDGVVLPYEYNGTVAPVHTTFYGMYDLYHAFGEGTEWDLPDRWVPRPAELDLETPLNFISTADTYGGNSGSPAVTKDLAVVGLNFDRNIEGLVRDFIYLPERGRNVMVDVRAIMEALGEVYRLDRIVRELRTGELAR